VAHIWFINRLTMKKLFTIVGLLLSFSLSGQILPGVVASQRIIVSACGGGSDSYGHTTSTTTGEDTQYADYVYATPITVTTCGTVTSVTVWVGSGKSTQTKAGIYTDNGSNAPQTLLTNGTSNEVNQTINGWNTYTFATPPSVNSATKYWVGLHSASNWILAYDTSIGITIHYMARSYALGFPASYSSGGNSGGNWLVYMTVQH